MNAPLASEALQGWRWPHAISAETAQRVIDVQSVLLIERSEPAFWRDFQDRALRQLGAHAVQASPWWRKWLGALPGGLSLANLDKLPVLRRADFRAAVESGGALALPASHGKAEECLTSGSTGMPVRFHTSQHTARVITAHYHADSERHRLDLRQPMALLVPRTPPHPGAPHHVVPANVPLGRGVQYHRRTIGYTMPEHARWLQDVDIAYLQTSPTALAGLLLECENGTAPPRRLQSVLTLAETVSPELRADARRVFGVDILDRYSTEEVGPIALQCPHDETRYHVCVSNVVLEVVDDAGQSVREGHPGSVLVTALHQWASPAVRYELGDIACLHPTCSCGAKVPSLSSLLGRKRFLLRLPTGERIYMRLHARDWIGVAPVREHRLTQTTPEDLLAEVVLERPLSAAEHAGLLAMLQQRVHPAFRYRVEQVDAIAWAPGGKRQEMVSLV